MISLVRQQASAAYLVVVTSLLAFLAGCAEQPVKDGAPRINKSVLLRVPDAIPKDEPVTNAGNKNPYQVFGKTYHLLPASKGYRARGTASWYGTKFHGRRTANGEIYDMNGMTAAHKTLPIPCYVRVTNTLNNRSVIVRVNDRGPFHGNRLIDLSYAAAVRLGFADRGTAPVEVEVVTAEQRVMPRRASTVPVREGVAARKSVAVPTVSPVSNTAEHWYLQAAAFYQEQPALKLRRRLEYITSLPVRVNAESEQSTTIYRVHIGPSNDQAPLQKLKNEMLAVRMGNPFIFTKNQ